VSLTEEQVVELLASFYPYRDRFREHRHIPEAGLDRDQILGEVRAMAAEEDRIGDSGKVSGSLYLGDHEQYHFLTEVFEAFAHANVLQRDMYPSATKFEGEIVAMAASMLHLDGAAGVVTSGGTESLMNPLLAYRELGRERGIIRPNIVIPASAHVALDKGAHYFGIEVVRAPLTSEFLVDLDWVRDHITADTVALVGSAGSYPYGQVDPIEQLGSLAQEHDIGLHVDGCLGGFVLPWIERLGVPVPRWDFRVPGVTSISADTHKYGYALKGTSVLLYRDAELRRRQYSTFPDWPGGLYVSPGMSGSRSGGVIAATWAAMVTTGEQGYLDAAADIHRTALELRAAVDAQPRLASQGEQTWFHVAFGAADPGLDVFLVNDALIERGWRLNPNQLPPGLHFCVTRPNTAAGVTESFRRDLAEAVTYAEAHAGEPARSGALYGMAGTPAGNAEMQFLLSGALDAMYAVPGPSRSD
jgi:glutamate/tyrosine decarboxylase-like PLP-dependent enzyme